MESVLGFPPTPSRPHDLPFASAADRPLGRCLARSRHDGRGPTAHSSLAWQARRLRPTQHAVRQRDSLSRCTALRALCERRVSQAVPRGDFLFCARRGGTEAHDPLFLGPNRRRGPVETEPRIYAACDSVGR